MKKQARGIGFNCGKYPSHSNRKLLKEYALWRGMLHRCSESLWIKYPTYIGTTCSENFKSYTFFYEWCQGQIGFNSVDKNGNKWRLDKDILVKGNKVYSEDTCCFVPNRINTLFIKRNSVRGNLPIGVHLDKSNGSFRAQCSFGKATHLGCFNTPEGAFKAYKTFKEQLIKDVANEYKDVLDNRVYQVLMDYAVEITD